MAPLTASRAEYEDILDETFYRKVSSDEAQSLVSSCSKQKLKCQIPRKLPPLDSSDVESPRSRTRRTTGESKPQEHGPACTSFQKMRQRRDLQRDVTASMHRRQTPPDIAAPASPPPQTPSPPSTPPPMKSRPQPRH